MTLIGKWQAAVRRRQAMRALDGLDAYILRDIGIGHGPRQGQVDRLVRNALTRRD